MALKPVGALVGMAGVAVMAVTMAVTAIAYSGTSGERYSPFDHYVSQLGEVGVSELAVVFNVGLVVGGLCFAIFMVGLGLARRTALAWLYVPVGIAAGIGGAFVGIFPMNNLSLHTIAATTFFMLGWIAVGLASLDFLRRRDDRFPWWLAIIGALTVAAFIGFLVYVTPTLEWAVIVGILAWTFATSFSWWRSERGGRTQRG